MDEKKTEREKLLEVIHKLNIEIPKKKYISNGDLKKLIMEYVNFSKKKKNNIDLTTQLKKKN